MSALDSRIHSEALTAPVDLNQSAVNAGAPTLHRGEISNVEQKPPDALASTVAKKMRAAYHDPDPLGAEAPGSPGPSTGQGAPRGSGQPARRPHRDRDHLPARGTTKPRPGTRRRPWRADRRVLRKLHNLATDDTSQ